MSDDFIPLNQSTPVRGKWQHAKNQNQSGGYHNQNNRIQNGQNRSKGHNNRWGNSRNSSYGSDSNTSFGQDKNNIDAYLHPSMLQDPWAHLRQRSN